MNKNPILKFLSVILVLIAIAAVTASASANTTLISVWHSLPKEKTPLFESIVNQYTDKTHGLVKIEITRFDSPEELHKKLVTGNSHPDVALIDTRWQEAISKKHKLAYIEDLMKQTSGSSVFIVFKMDTFESMWESSKYNGKLLSMPFSAVNRALIINQDIMQKLAINNTPSSWSEITSIGKKIAETKDEKGAGNVWAFSFPLENSPEELTAIFQVFLWQKGKSLYQPFMDGELADFDSAEGQSVLNMMARMTNADKIAPAEQVSLENVAMFIGTPDDYLRMKNEGKNLKVVRWPGLTKSSSKNNITVSGFIVFDNGDKPKKEKIWHMIYEACEFKSGLKWSLATSYLPPNKQVTLSPGYFAYLESNPGLRTFLQQLKNARADANDQRKQTAEKILGENLKQALMGKIKTQDALKIAAERSDMVLDPSGKLRAKKVEISLIGEIVDKFW